MKIFLEPNDVLMFRDGKPFSGGDDHFARGIFPPSPATFYGALRSKILSVSFSDFEKYGKSETGVPEDVKMEVGTPDSPGSLSIKTLCLGKKTNAKVIAYYPVPRDMVSIKDEGKKLLLLSPEAEMEDLVKTNLPGELRHLWHRNESAVEGCTGFLSEQDFMSYLTGKLPTEVIPVSEVVEKEPRIGIRLDKNSRSVVSGGLYSVEYFRLNQGVGFLVDVDGSALFPRQGLLRLGGDHRSVFYEEVEWKPPSPGEVQKMVAEKKRFKIILITPAIYSRGWLPTGIDSSSFEGEIMGVRVKLAAVATGRPTCIGGFDLAKQYPKPMRKAVPAGSVYYFELMGNNGENVFEKLQGSSCTDFGEKEGFGIIMIGGY